MDTLLIYVLLLAGLELEHSGTEEIHEDKGNGLVSEEPDVARDQWFNPVLQNHSALVDWLANTKQGSGLAKIQGGHPGRKRRDLQNLACSSEVCSRSLCPWREGFDLDRNRIPQFINYAECDEGGACNYNNFGLGQSSRNLLRHSTSCQTVKTEFLVNENGVTKWMTDWPIACICTRNPTSSATSVRLVPSSTSFNRVSSIGFSAGASRMAVDVDVVVNDRLRMRHQPTTNGETSHLTRGQISKLSRSERRAMRAQRRRLQVTSETFGQLMARRENDSGN